MKKPVVIAMTVVMAVFANGVNAWDSDRSNRIQQYDAYGTGVHNDQYGRPATLEPTYGPSDANAFNRIQKYDAYGMGVHEDLYGRPVTVQPTYGYPGSYGAGRAQQ